MKNPSILQPEGRTCHPAGRTGVYVILLGIRWLGFKKGSAPLE